MKLADYARKAGGPYRTGKTLEIVNEADKRQDELLQDLISIITSFCSRIYGLRRSKRETERLIAELQANGGDDKAS